MTKTELGDPDEKCRHLFEGLSLARYLLDRFDESLAGMGAVGRTGDGRVFLNVFSM